MLMVTELLWIMMVFIFFCIVVCIFQIFYNLQDLFILRENHIIIEQKKKRKLQPTFELTMVWAPYSSLGLMEDPVAFEWEVNNHPHGELN